MRIALFLIMIFYLFPQQSQEGILYQKRLKNGKIMPQLYDALDNEEKYDSLRMELLKSFTIPREDIPIVYGEKTLMFPYIHYVYTPIDTVDWFNKNIPFRIKSYEKIIINFLIPSLDKLEYDERFYKLQNEKLLITNNDKTELVFSYKTNKKIRSFLGESKFLGFHEKITLFNYTWDDIYTFELKSANDEYFQIWFDKSYNLVLYEKTHFGYFRIPQE
jgi:hypothetical protein